MATQTPPQNTDAEASMLGAILIDTDAIVKIADAITVQDFYDQKHARIYEALLALYEKRSPIDVLTLADQLKGTGFLDMVGGPAYLTELTNYVPTAAHVEQYADIVAQKSLRRRLISASNDMAELGRDESKSLKELIEEAESRLFAVSQQHVKQSVVSLENILAESFERLDDLHKDKGKLRGIPTGYKDLDTMLAGFQRSDLFVLAARPSIGKTAFVLNLAHKVATQAKEPVLIFSLEMSKEQLVDRLLAMESGVDAWALRTGNLTDSDFEQLGEAMGALSEAKIYIDDTPGITVSDMRTKARREAHTQKLGLVIVDYLQLMSGGSRYSSEGNRVQEISEISRGLKGLARELDVPVIALSQLSRSVESRSPQIPQLSDLRESGCVTGDTLVYLPQTGQQVPIRDLVHTKNVRISSVNTTTYHLETKPVMNAFATGVKPVYRLTTKTGRTIRATANHKFLTITGWKRLDALSAGEHLATPRILPEPRRNSTMTAAELGLLGHLIGDGCTLPRHIVQYTTRDYDIAEIVSELATTAFGEQVAPRIQKERTWYQVYLPANFRLTHGVRNPIALWLDSLGAFGLRSYEKRIPDEVLLQPNEYIAVFLRHLWATDGCIRRGKSYPTIYYASSSLELAQGVQSLLLRFGIAGRLTRHPQVNKGRDQYHVHVSGHADLRTFGEQIGAVGEAKRVQMAGIMEYLERHPGNPNRDVIPKAAWQLYVQPALQATKLTTRAFQERINTPYCGTSLYKCNLSRARTSQVAAVLQSPVLQSLATSDIYWDEILSVTPDGIEEVFDLTVPVHHNFIANNIIIHNSIEQDADIVAFLYREDYYNPDSERKNIMEVQIKKHRNGPTGNIELYFDRDKQRIRSLDSNHESNPFGS